MLPNVQFVVTTHSPLLVLGMKRVFGEDGFALYRCPMVSKLVLKNSASSTVRIKPLGLQVHSLTIYARPCEMHSALFYMSKERLT